MLNAIKKTSEIIMTIFRRFRGKLNSIISRNNISQNNFDETQFDEKFYLEIYPDISRNGINPLEHFMLHGRAEGRLGKQPHLKTVGNIDDFNSSFENIVVVSHEATLTGAPVLALNIAHELSNKYNVFVILLGLGPIADSFYKKGIIVISAESIKSNEMLVEYLLDDFLGQVKIKFVIVNTIVSSSVLPFFAKRNIPTLSLIHEFASSVKEKGKFRKSCFWANQVVFSSNITYKNMVEEIPDLKDVPVNIVPQGKCNINFLNNKSKNNENHQRLIKLFQSRKSDDSEFLIVGIGTIYYRKGVDLFIQCAAHIKNIQPKNKFKFIWIGKNVDEELKTDYCSYLKDQIQRNSLEEEVSFFDESDDIQFIYEFADALLLTSRLDPLPNVAIDALTSGLPVLCFDKASGIADIMKEEGLGSVCVAPFLDVHALAEILLNLFNSKELLANVKSKCQNLAKTRFNLSNYVCALEKIGLAASEVVEQFMQDVADIEKSELFRFDYAILEHWKDLSPTDVIKAYVRGWKSGFDLRKPMPGFHPGVYKEQHGLKSQYSDPFADYIRAGCPEGPWNTEVMSDIDSGSIDASNLKTKIALHIHVFYPEVLREILGRLAFNITRPDLFISISNPNIEDVVEKIISTYDGRVVRAVLTPNCGRDIGPFVTEFGKEIIESYEIIGHVHTKISPHAANEVGKNWSNFLLENLLGNEFNPMVDKILHSMSNNESVGLVYPDDPLPIGWDKNYKYAFELACKLNIQKPLDKHINFPVGTMFWARTKKLTSLIELGLNWSDYPAEPLPIDGTMLHSIERLIPYLPTQVEMKSIVTNIRNVTR